MSLGIWPKQNLDICLRIRATWSIIIKDQDIRFGKYNKDLYRECEWCYQVFEIEKAFKENAFMCNECYKLLQKEKIRDVNLLINVKAIELEKIFFNYIESLKTVC